MSDTAHSPIVIDRVDRGRGDGEEILLRLSGQWLVETDQSADAILVVSQRGQRHRFAPLDPEPGGPASAGWHASFAVPDWAVPVEYGQASLWVGSAPIPVPPVGTRLRDLTAPRPHATDELRSAPSAATPIAPSAPAPPPAADPRSLIAMAPPSAGDTGRGGPLADALIKETVSVLHAELEQRSVREARLNAALDQARSELAARTAVQAELEATHGELRAELSRLTGAVADQRAEFDRGLADAAQRSASELAEARADADAELARARADADAELAQARADADAELAQARAQLDRGAAELASVRDQFAGLAQVRDQLAGANERLAASVQSDGWRAQEAAELREQLAAAQIARDATTAEVGGLRAELARLGSELAVTREQTGVGADGLDEARRLLEDARAMTAKLQGSS